MINVEEYLSKFDKFTKDPTLEAMEYLMSKFDNPHKKIKCIHVAGTNGKGSVCEMLNSCLIHAGYKVGKFISPHLLTFNDGICINNIPIEDEEASDILEELSIYIDEYNSTHEIKVKWFEVITSLVFIYFEKQKCDFAVIETGLGGDVDCTNIIEPLVSIITKIGYDHVDILGSSLQEIATHKSGIIKQNSETVIIEQPDIMEVIEKKCKERNNKLHVIKQDEIKDYVFNIRLQVFTFRKYKYIGINLLGEAQVYNATEVLETLDILKEKGYKIPEEAIRTGLANVVHKARMEVLRRKPLLIFDGGHNESAIKNLKENIKKHFYSAKRMYIISILDTKDYKTILKELSEDEDAIFFLTSGNKEKNYLSNEELFEEAKKYIEESRIFLKSLEESINIVTSEFKYGTVFIVGSFYVYKDVVKIIKTLEQTDNKNGG